MKQIKDSLLEPDTNEPQIYIKISVRSSQGKIFADDYYFKVSGIFMTGIGTILC